MSYIGTTGGQNNILVKICVFSQKSVNLTHVILKNLNKSHTEIKAYLMLLHKIPPPQGVGSYICTPGGRKCNVLGKVCIF